MGIEITVILGALVVLMTSAGSYMGGKKTGKSQTLNDAATAVNVLAASLAELRQQRDEDDRKIQALEAKVEILESMVTQRADVKGVREVVDRIAVKMGA